MSVVGIDLGTSKTTVSIVGKGGIDTVTNNVSGRKTASQVGFDNLQRCLGETAKTNWKRNFRKTLRFPKRFIGRDHSECGVEWEHAGAAKHVCDEDGSVHVELFFKGENYNFSMEQIVAMLFTHVKEITEDFTKLPAADIVVTVPGYWSDRRRRALLDAAHVAGLNVIRVVNDLTAVAINYLYGNRKKITAEEVRKVMIVDCGTANTGVGIFEFQHNQLKTLGCAYDANLGGRDIDGALAHFFNDKFIKKTGCDIKDQPKSWLRLLEACEGVKKTLNLGGVSAGINEEMIMEDFDLSEQISREEYLELLAPLIERLQATVHAALEKAETTAEELFSIEWVGGSMRVEAFQLAVADVVGKAVENHMNAEEAQSHGAALQCAYESPRIKLQNQFAINEIQDNGIIVSWGPPENPEEQSLALIKSNGRASYKPKQLTLKRPTGPMQIILSYEDKTVDDPIIASYYVKDVPRVSDTDIQDVVVKFKYDNNFITNLTTIYVANKVEIEYQEEVKEEPKKDTKKADKKTKSKDSEDVEMKDSEENVTNVQKKYVTKTKTETKKIPVEWVIESPRVSADTLKKWQDVENSLREIDNTQIKCDSTKNALESYVYTTRTALAEKLGEFTTPEESTTFLNDLNSNESWLYDEGVRQPLEVYESRLNGLKAQGDRYFKRYNEWNTRDEAISYFNNVLNNYREIGANQTEEYEHIEKFGDILVECDRVSAIMEEKFAAMRALTKLDDPVNLSSDITERATNLGKFCQEILNTPKPKVEPVPETKTPEQPNTEPMETDAVPETTAEPSTETPEQTPTGLDTMDID